MVKTVDVLVLGAGIVGVSTALALQEKGRDVLLLDRHARAGQETSFGNAGLIERTSFYPYLFPWDLRAFFRYASNLAPEAHYHWQAIPRLLPWLWRYFRASSPTNISSLVAASAPLITHCLEEHERFAQAAGVSHWLRPTGWIKLYRSPALLEKGIQEAQRLQPYHLSYDILDAQGVRTREPHIQGEYAGALHFKDPVSLADPGGLVEAYAKLFVNRGGMLTTGDARTLTQETKGDWSVVLSSLEHVRAPQVVIALGPWADDVFRPLGYHFPFAVKRGYHIHFEPIEEMPLTHPILDAQSGYLLAPMSRGIRLTTGAEFADRDAPPTPVQIAQTEPLARRLFPLGRRLETHPWMGSRPCLPDMQPILGPAPRHQGLWFHFGHQHHGLTLGPISARLLAQMMTGETPFTDPTPYRAERWV